MSYIREFRAIRPAPEFADKVAAPPYDVMTSAEAREMVTGNEYSFLWIDRAEINFPPSVSPYEDKVYDMARERLYAMLRDEVFIRDDAPRFYIYRQTMEGRSQTGLVACASIDEYLGGAIKKHEHTLAEKERDRISHIDRTDANTGPIFLAYRSGDGALRIPEQKPGNGRGAACASGEPSADGIKRELRDWTSGHSPVYRFVSDDGVGHEVWVIDDEAAAARIKELFARIPALYIADGHHRNASAVKVGLMRRKEAEEASGKYDSDAEYNFYLSVIFPHDELYIMDYNRLVRDLNGYAKEEFLGKISDCFDVRKLPKGQRAKPAEPRAFGMYMSGEWYLLRAKPSIIPKDQDAWSSSSRSERPDPVGSLDVSLLQNSLLGPILGVDDPRTDKRIDFVGGMRGLGELERRVDSGEMAVAFAMFPTSMDELMDIADAGEVMPPKSTWFEPKLRCGLFVHKLS